MGGFVSESVGSLRLRTRHGLALSIASALVVSGLVALTPAAVVADVVAPDPAATGELLVSRINGGISSETFLSSDGQHVAFTSTERLSADDDNDHADVYLASAIRGSADPFSGAPQLVSITEGGSAGNAASSEPAASADGRWIAFTSAATDLVPGGGTDGRTHVYIRDTRAGTTLRLQSPGVEPDAASSDPDISDDGRWVVFTSSAQNLGVSGGAAGSDHVYLADLDDDADGVTSLLIHNGAPGQPEASDQPAISGNGAAIVFRVPPADPAADPYGTLVWRELTDAPTETVIDSVPGSEPAIDGSGNVIAFTADSCDSLPHIVAVTFTGNGSHEWLGSALGVTDIDNTAGVVSHPTVSSDGNMIAWETTQREEGAPAPPAALALPVIRMEAPSWPDAWFNGSGTPISCSETFGADAVEIGEGHAPTLSAAGRTVAYSAESDLAPAAQESALVFVTDGGGPAVTVSTVQGYVTAPAFIKEVQVGGIPASAAQGVQSAIAGAPIHQLPIHQLPIHQLPIHQLPIHQLPIHQLPIHQLPINQLPIHQLPIHQLPIHQLPIHQLPIHQLPIYLDGQLTTWSEILTGTPFAGQPEDAVSVDDVLQWAAAALAVGSGATEAELAAAQRIQSLTVGESDGARTWAEILVGTPFEGESELTVTLGEVLDWAAATVANPAATDIQRVAAERIRALTLGDLGIDASGIDALSMASIVLGNAPLAKVEIPGEGIPAQRWQRLADAQGLGVTVGETTPLAVLDWAGLDVTRAGVEQVTLGSLRADPAVLDSTTLGSMAASSLEYYRTTLGELPISALSDPARIFTDPLTGAVLSGTLGGASWPFREDATLADVIAVVPADITLGAVFETLLDRQNYPWEQLAISDVNPAWSGADMGTVCLPGVGCNNTVRYRFAFDSAPGQTLDYLGSTVEIALPTGTWASSSLGMTDTAGPVASVRRLRMNNSTWIADGNRVRLPLGDVQAGTVTQLDVGYGSTTSIADGPVVGRVTYTLPGEAQPSSAEHTLYHWRSLLDWDDPEKNMDSGDPMTLWYPLFEDSIYFGWISPSELTFDGISNSPGVGEDEDFYLVPAPQHGQRVVVSTNASDGQLSISLYTTANTGAPLGTESAGPAPGTEVQTQPAGSEGDGARSGTDAGAPLLMAPAESGGDASDIGPATLLDESVVPGDGTSQVSAAGTQVAGAEYLVLRVASGDGRPSESAYTLRVTTVEEPEEVACAPAILPFPDAGGAPDHSDALVPGDDGTNTLYLLDQARFDQTWGTGSSASVRDGIDELEGVGGVRGAVIAVDSSAAVQGARAALDGNPCSMSRRADLSKAVNQYVTSILGDAGVPREQITSIVMVGGDDILPLAPVAEHVPQYSETGHADELRLRTLADGSPCPASSVQLAVDPCATPLSAAAAAGYVLTDDPYGLPSAYDTAGGVLYLPNTALGRLVESPAQISATLARFVAADGEIAADSLATAGYGAWSELPDAVSSSLAWRNPATVAVDSNGDGIWDRSDVARVLGTADASSARVVALNAHFDEGRMLPGVPNAADADFRANDLFTSADALADDESGADPLSGALVFTIGCHAANNLPSAYYPARTDWVDVFSGAAGFVGNTGFGYANNVVTALSERLLGTYSSWLGVSVDGDPVTTGAALMRAKHSYLGGLGLYAGYDEKVLMQTVYYGLPMYTLSGSTAEPPAYKAAPALVPSTTAGLVSAGLSFSDIGFEEKTSDEGKDYLSVAGEEQLVLTGEPVLPRLVRELPAPVDPTTTARGALITGLTSEFGESVEPLIAEATAGVDEPQATSRTGMAFPSTFAHLSRQSTPEGSTDLLVVTPARAQIGAAGKGIFESFTDLDIDIVYGDAGSDDDLDPQIEWTGTKPMDGGVRVMVHADGTGSPIAGGIVLAQPQGSSSGEWKAFDLIDGADAWYADVTIDGPFRWFVQVIDEAGNVAIDTGRGHLDVALADPPTLEDVADVTLAPGANLLVTVGVTDADPTERLTAQYRWLGDEGEVRESGIASVSPTQAGAVRAVIDAMPPSGGAFRVELEVCRGDACSTTTFGVVVQAADPPTALVTLESSDDPVEPDSVLTATASGTDPNGAQVTLAYRWLRNGAPLDGFDGAELDLAAVGAEHGDTFTLEVIPSDGVLTGGAARASMSVGFAPGPPANPDPPTIAASATNTEGPYESGWSVSPVTVTFTCAGYEIDFCSKPVTVQTDTDATGTKVTGTVTDGLGRSATAEFIVVLDGTPPELHPVATPSIVTVGGLVAVAPHATDEASGVASESCDVPQTTTPGPASAMCHATDNAGNTADGAASYTVLAPPAAPRCRGFADRTGLAPLNADGSSVFLRTSGVPVIFAACDAKGNPIGTKNFVQSVMQTAAVELPRTAKLNELWYPPVPKFSYVRATGTWVGTIPTLNLASGKKYTYRIGLSDGTSFLVTFGVR